MVFLYIKTMTQTSYYSKYLKKQSKEIDQLSSEDKDILLKLLEAGLDDKEEASKPIQIREIVPIEEWVNDSYYIGKAGVSLYDYWKEELIDIFKTENNPQYNEIIIEGGLGCVNLNTIYKTSAGRFSLRRLIEIKNTDIKRLKSMTIKSDKGIAKIYDANSVGIKKTKKITFSNGSYVEGTLDHRIKVLKKSGRINWCHFENLTKETPVVHIDEKTNKVSFIFPVKIEDGECECGDISVEGEVYLRDGMINHNTGKSTFATHVVQRFFYELSCWKNIPALFGLKNTTSISGMYFSLTKEQAEISGFRDIRNLIDDTPYFKDHFPRKEVLDSRLDFPENVFIYYGADVSHQISLNLVLSIVDEANFFKDSKARKQSSNKFMGSKVAELHSSLLNRQASRFSNKEGNKSLSILISSPSFYSSYTQTRIELAKKNPHAKVIKPRLWDTKPEMYSGKKFFVFLGNERLDPKIIETKEDLNTICESMETHKVDSEDINKAMTECPLVVRDLIDEVPVEFYENYRTNLPQSIADISAHSVQTQGKLFNSRKVFFSCVDKELPNLFFKTAFTISTNANSKTEPIEFYLRAPFAKQNKERFIHIDQSVSGDCTGIASVYRDDEVYSIDDAGVEHVKRPVVIDFALKIIPPVDGGQIDIEVVRSFVLYMANKLKLKIGKVTYDQFQSTESIQYLKKLGFNAAKQSVESEVPYLSFLKLFYQNEIKMPEQAAELIAEEIFDLQHLRELKKVDHVEGKSKDVCDAVVGAVWGCLNHGMESSKASHTYEDAQSVVAANAYRDSGRRELFSVDSFITRKWR